MTQRKVMFGYEAVEHVKTSIENAGGDPNDYDLDGIVDATFKWDQEKRGWYQVADHDEFWGEVENHATGS